MGQVTKVSRLEKLHKFKKKHNILSKINLLKSFMYLKDNYDPKDVEGKYNSMKQKNRPIEEILENPGNIEMEGTIQNTKKNS